MTSIGTNCEACRDSRLDTIRKQGKILRKQSRKLNDLSRRLRVLDHDRVRSLLFQYRDHEVKVLSESVSGSVPHRIAMSRIRMLDDIMSSSQIKEKV
jgi:hypothetical protein